jgi:hypothetical protein
MARDGELSDATPPEVTRFHAAKHDVYRLLQELDRASRTTMAPFRQATTEISAGGFDPMVRIHDSHL